VSDLPLTSSSALSVQAAVRLFVADVFGAGVDVAIYGDGSVPQTTPHAVVQVVSDVGVGPTYTVDDFDAGTVAYAQQRQIRAQVDIVGTMDAGRLAQSLALHWRSDSAAARASVARGLAPSTTGGVRVSASDGGAGTVVGASVDLRGYYREATEAVSNPDALVDQIDTDISDTTLTVVIDEDGSPGPGPGAGPGPGGGP
jgi:hypothetical protein